MISKTYIRSNLNQIDNLYKKSTSNKVASYFSKLAILELCGWIEESMDEIVRRCVYRRLKDSTNIQFVEDTIIQRTYGFEYKRYFRNMLLQVLGIINLEKLECELDKRKFSQMQSTLDTLKTCRDREAHTHLKGATRRLDAPSVTKSRFDTVYNGLRDIENCTRKMKF